MVEQNQNELDVFIFVFENLFKIRTVQYLKKEKIYVLKNMLLLRNLYFFFVKRILKKI